MSYEQQFVTIKIPKGYNADDFEAIGSDIVQFIRDRCAVGVGVRRRGSGFTTYDFPEYTEQYAAKKGSRKVDLRLSDEMLDSIEVLSVDEGTVTVGFHEGDPINGKAEGNQIGSYGGEPNAKRARRFLGVTRDELEAILGAYERDDGKREGDAG